MRSRGASYSPPEIYGILMVRALAHKKPAKQKSGKIARPAKKAKSKAALKMLHGNSSSKGKVSSRKVTGNEAKKVKKETRRHAHPIHKESRNMEAESRKPALKAGVTSATEASAHLLRQTKSTSAALAVLAKGVELIFQKDFKKAKSELKGLLETYPGELEILARARSYIQICEREEANMKKPPVTSDQLYTLGVLEHNKANYDAAISYFLQSLEKHPDADYIYYSVAASQAMKGDLAQAIESLRKAVDLNEDSRIYAKNDADFSALQSKKEFAELIGINQPPAAESR
jgi:tetratricopeptide (TPR) repeat protein